MPEMNSVISQQNWDLLQQRLRNAEELLQLLSERVNAHMSELRNIDEELSEIEQILSHRVTPTQREELLRFLKRRGKEPK